MLHSLYVELFLCCTLFFALSSGYTLPLLHFYHIPLFPCFDFSFILHVFFVLHFFMLLFFLVAIFSCFSLSLLHYFHAAFLCCTLLM